MVNTLQMREKKFAAHNWEYAVGGEQFAVGNLQQAFSLV